MEISVTDQDPGSASRHPGVEQHARQVSPAFVMLLGILRYGRVFALVAFFRARARRMRHI